MLSSGGMESNDGIEMRQVKNNRHNVRKNGPPKEQQLQNHQEQQQQQPQHQKQHKQSPQQKRQIKQQQPQQQKQEQKPGSARPEAQQHNHQQKQPQKQQQVRRQKLKFEDEIEQQQQIEGRRRPQQEEQRMNGGIEVVPEPATFPSSEACPPSDPHLPLPTPSPSPLPTIDSARTSDPNVRGTVRGSLVDFGSSRRLRLGLSNTDLSLVQSEGGDDEERGEYDVTLKAALVLFHMIAFGIVGGIIVVIALYATPDFTIDYGSQANATIPVENATIPENLTFPTFVPENRTVSGNSTGNINTNTSSDSDQHNDLLRNLAYYVSNWSDTSMDDILLEGSPHNRAAMWVAASANATNTSIPHTSVPIDTTDGYRFMTIYILAYTYFSLSGDDWTSDLNFLSGYNFCAWNEPYYVDDEIIAPNPTGFRGVKCDEQTHEITSLSLGNNNLTGGLPSEIGLLTSLTRIDFNSNGITGTIPRSLGELTDLDHFSIANNRLAGTLPEMGRLTSLMIFDFGYNNITGSIPASLRELTDLEYFSIANNNLTGTLPTEIGLLTSLTIFDLNSNNITGSIPSSVQELTDLERVWLADNTLTGTIPSWIDLLQQLQSLDLSNNALYGELPLELSSMDLTFLSLENNDFSGTISDVFGNNNIDDGNGNVRRRGQVRRLQHNVSHGGLMRLEYLYLGGNNFRGNLYDIFMTKRNLRILDLSNNKFKGSLPDHFLENMPSLEILDMHSNSLSGTLPTTMTGNSVLRFLSLHQNSFDGPIPSHIGKLGHLLHLDLSCNTLSGSLPSELGELEHLESLFLGHNVLKSSIPNSIVRLTSLRQLSLRETQLNDRIPEFVGSLTNLVLLDLANNMLSGLIPSALGTLNQLEFLLLDGNELTKSIPSDLRSLTSLHLIRVDDNNGITGNLDIFCNGRQPLLETNTSHPKYSNFTGSLLPVAVAATTTTITNTPSNFTLVIADCDNNIATRDRNCECCLCCNKTHPCANTEELFMFNDNYWHVDYRDPYLLTDLTFLSPNGQ